MHVVNPIDEYVFQFVAICNVMIKICGINWINVIGPDIGIHEAVTNPFIQHNFSPLKFLLFRLEFDYGDINCAICQLKDHILMSS